MMCGLALERGLPLSTSADAQTTQPWCHIIISFEVPDDCDDGGSSYIDVGILQHTTAS